MDEHVVIIFMWCLCLYDLHSLEVSRKEKNKMLEEDNLSCEYFDDNHRIETKKLESKIKPENKELFDSTSDGSLYHVEKFLAWQEEYDGIVNWKDFLENYHYCQRCNSWQEGICICYAR